MTPYEGLPQTTAAKMEAHNCLEWFCMLKHYDFPSLELQGRTHARASLIVPLSTQQGP